MFHVPEHQVAKPGNFEVLDLVNDQVLAGMIEHLGSEYRLVSHTVTPKQDGGLFVTLLAEADEEPPTS